MTGAAEEPGSSPRLSRFPWRAAAALAVFLAALGVREAHLAASARHSPFHAVAFSDSAGYLELGRRVAAGDRYAGDVAFLQGPGYPYFLGGLLALRERMPARLRGAEVTFIRHAGAVVGATACALLFCLAAGLLGLPAGLVAGLAAAAYGPAVFLDTELVPDGGLLVALIVIALLLARSIWLRELANPRHAPLFRWAALGLVLGLASLVRMNLVPFALLLALWGARVHRFRGRWTVAACWVALLAGLALPLGLAAARNWAVSRRVGVVFGGGLNLWLGNNPRWRDTARARPGPQWREIWALPGVRPETDPAAWDREYKRRVWAWVRSAPGDFALSVAEKATELASGHERRRNFDLYHWGRWSGPLRALVWHAPGGLAFPFALVAPLALLGLVLRRKHWRADLPLLLFLVSYALAILPFFVTSRYRLPLALLLLPHAAVAVVEVARRLPGSLALLVPIAPLVWAASLQTEPRDARFEGELAVVRGDAARDAGRPDEARRLWREALGLWPGYPEALTRLAEDEEARGDERLALALLEQGVAFDPAGWTGRWQRARLLERQGELEAALADYRAAARVAPDLHFLRTAASRCLLALGRPDEARQAALEALRRWPEDAEARILHARAAARLRRER